MKHTLSLLENAMDSLAEALKKYEEGEGGESKAYKFAVLHMSHFVELIFKYHISNKHHLLIYKNPFSEKIDKNITIGLWEAINFISNEGESDLGAQFKSDLRWLKKLRNDIEHHKFEMDVNEVRVSLGRLFSALVEFIEAEESLEIKNHIPAETWETFKTLSDEYAFKLKDAIKEADRIEEENTPAYDSGEYRTIRVICENCGNPTMVVNPESDGGFKCTFCGSDEGDNLPAFCDMCGAESTVEEMDYWRDEETGGVETRCYYCSGRYFMEKDD